MNLWIIDTVSIYTLVTFAETEEEARKKVEAYLSGESDSIATITKSEEEVINV